jgi:AmmeMemoRadiSam system protein B
MTDGTDIRSPAVAGLFYPDDPETLAAQVKELLAGVQLPAGSSVTTRRPRALIVPHAGYSYSGPVAASAYACLQPYAREVHRVVLLGPSHRVFLRGMAVPSSTAFRTPLGDVRVDRALLERVLRLPGVVVADEPHAQEHSVEVQLPFLQTVLGEFSVLPIVVGDCSGDQVARVLEALWNGLETLFIISSDLSHYLPFELAKEVDAETSRAIVACRGDITPEAACGAHAVNGLLRFADAQHLQASQLDVRNSGDTAGDRSQVVGYGAYAFS